MIDDIIYKRSETKSTNVVEVRKFRRVDSKACFMRSIVLLNILWYKTKRMKLYMQIIHIMVGNYVNSVWHMICHRLMFNIHERILINMKYWMLLVIETYLLIYLIELVLNCWRIHLWIFQHNINKKTVHFRIVVYSLSHALLLYRLIPPYWPQCYINTKMIKTHLSGCTSSIKIHQILGHCIIIWNPLQRVILMSD